MTSYDVQVSAAGIAVPPVAFAVVITLAYMLLPYYERGSARGRKGKVQAAEQEEQIRSDDRVRRQRLGPIFVMLAPFLATNALCPPVIASRILIIVNFYGGEYPDGGINQALNAYLMPAGILFGVFLGTSLDMAMSKRSRILEIVYDQARILLNLARLLPKSNGGAESVVLQRLQAEARKLNVRLVGSDSEPANIWGVVSDYRGAVSFETVGDGAIFSKVLKLASAFDDLTFELRALHKSRFNILHWALIEFVSLTAFVGVLLLETGSGQMNLSVCMATAFAISLMNLILADIDEPFHGLFVVPTRPVERVIDGIHEAASRPQATRKREDRREETAAPVVDELTYEGENNLAQPDEFRQDPP